MDLQGTADYGLVTAKTIQTFVGFLALAFPLILLAWGLWLGIGVLDSLSDYYVYRTRDAFVGSLLVIALCLFAYRGYERKDDLAGDAAGLFAVFIALSPSGGATWERALHFTAAVLFFLTLSLIATFLFTKTGSVAPMTPQKKIRNRIYVASGAIIVASVVLIGVYGITGLDGTALATIRPVLVLEAAAVWAFGFAWLIKGETFVADPVPRRQEREVVQWT